MADQFQYPTMAPADITAAVEQSIGGVNPERQQAQDLASFSYNQPTGDFGTAYPKSRRKMRMEEEERKFLDQQFQQQKALQEMAINQGALELRQLEYNRMRDNDILSLEEKLQKERDDERARKDAFGVADSIRGVVLPNGQRLRPIRPEDPDAVDRLNDVLRINPRALENDLGKKIWESAMVRAEAYAQKSIQDQQKDAEKLQDWIIGQNEEASSLGVDASKFYNIDESGNIIKANRIGLSKAIGEAKRNSLEKTAQAALSSDIAKESKTEIKAIVDQIYKNGSEIRKYDSLVEGAKSSVERNEYIRQANFFRGEDAVLRQRLSGFVPQQTQAGQQPAITKFNSAQEAEAANLPKGTIVEIGGRKARID